VVLGEEARDLDLVGRQDVDGEKVSESMVSGCQVVKDRVVGGSEVTAEEVDEKFTPCHVGEICGEGRVEKRSDGENGIAVLFFFSDPMNRQISGGGGKI
jgi:hypothetical protein